MMKDAARLAAKWWALAICAGLTLGGWPAALRAQPIGISVEPTLRATVKMRDGVPLATYVWLPRVGTRHPALLFRSPYGLRYGPE
jgi:hypothetical protein